MNQSKKSYYQTDSVFSRNGFPHLVPDKDKEDGNHALLSPNNIRFRKDQLIVRVAYETPRSQSNRFTQYDIFCEQLYDDMNPKRVFHEIFTKNNCIKMFFDLDCETETFTLNDKYDLFTLRDALIKACQEIMGFQLYDVLICDSSNQQKFSQHIIINRLRLTNFEVAKQIAIDTLDRLPLEIKQRWGPQLRNIVDMQVYRNNGSLRMIYTTKNGRMLVPLREWHFKGMPIKYKTEWACLNVENYEPQYPMCLPVDYFVEFCYPQCEHPTGKRFTDIVLLRESLVTNCRNYPLFEYIVKKQPTRFIDENAFIDGEDIITVDKFISTHELGFVIRGKTNNIISLIDKARKPCLVCGTVHDHENPFIFVENTDNARMYNIHCRRAGKSQMLFGIPKNPIHIEIVE